MTQQSFKRKRTMNLLERFPLCVSQLEIRGTGYFLHTDLVFLGGKKTKEAFQQEL